MDLPSRIVKRRENRVKHAGDFHRPGQQSESLVNARKYSGCDQAPAGPGLAAPHRPEAPQSRQAGDVQPAARSLSFPARFRPPPGQPPSAGRRASRA